MLALSQTGVKDAYTTLKMDKDYNGAMEVRRRGREQEREGGERGGGGGRAEGRKEGGGEREEERRDEGGGDGGEGSGVGLWRGATHISGLILKHHL